MEQGVDQLYRSAVEKMAKSADSDIEKLRRSVIKDPGSLGAPNPDGIAEASGRDASWGSYAFDSLRSHGFIQSDLMRFKWFQPTSPYIDDEMAALAGIEATAIIRLASLDCAAARAELRKREKTFEQTARAGKPLASSLAHQKLMLSVVAATGEVHLLEEYAKRATVALAYAQARRLDGDALKGMVRSAGSMIRTICSMPPRDCAAAATAMRLHPRTPVEA